MKTITIKQEYLEMIRDRRKPLEVRVGYPNILTIKKGDHILLMSGPIRQYIKVTDVRRYRKFDEMLEYEDSNNIIPGSNKNLTLKKLREIYPPEKESLGVIVIEVQPVESQKANI